jgi:hypothetical protein
MSKASNNRVKLNTYVSVKDFGAVGDGVSNDAQAFQNAINSLVYQYGTGTLHIPAGVYKLDTTAFGGPIVLPEGIQVEGDGGHQVRNFGVSNQGTKLHIYGTIYSAFTYARGCSFSKLQIDYPAQLEDPVTPVVYPYTFQYNAAVSSGTKCRFNDIYFERTYAGIQTQGATTFTNIHGSFYSNMFYIVDALSFININNCSCTPLWAHGVTSNTVVWQTSNLSFVKITGSCDGLKLSNCYNLGLRYGIEIVGSGTTVNLVTVDSCSFDGVKQPLRLDPAAELFSMQFTNCLFLTTVTSGAIPTAAFDINSAVGYAGSIDYRTLTFSNCIFKSGATGVISINGNGMDHVIVDGCTFLGWNTSGVTGAQARSAIYVNSTLAKVTITGCSFSDRLGYNAGRLPSALTIQNAKSVSVSGNTVDYTSYGVRLLASGVIGNLLVNGNSANLVTTPTQYDNTAVATAFIDKDNSWVGAGQVSASCTATTAITTLTTVVFDVKVFDSAVEYNAATGVFTALTPGIYSVSALLTSSAGTSGDVFQIRITKSASVTVQRKIAMTTQSQSYQVSGRVSLTAGQTLSVEVSRVSGAGSFSLTGVSNENKFDITKL